MRTVGKFLILSAVFLRAVVVLSEAPPFPVIAALLAAYGVLLLVETWLAQRATPWLVQSAKIQLVYLFVQALLVLGMLIVSNYEDFLAELFIPLSLDAVLFLGTRDGFRLITAFALTITGALLFSEEGILFGLAMAVLYSGICFVFGGYAGQVQKAEAARARNQQTYTELQEAHHQLQAYADRLATLAIEQERNHLARDLHDSVTQTVFSMNLAAQSARLLWGKEPARVGGQLNRLEALAASAQREIQSLVSQLSPSSVTEIGLPAALQKLALEQQAKNGLHVSLELHGEENLSEAITTGLYAIAQEALTNIAKHSGVCEAVVQLRLAEASSCLEIEDHGRGFNLQSRSEQRGHFGLAGMTERAREIGWSLSVESKPGHGTRVRVSQSTTGESQ